MRVVYPLTVQLDYEELKYSLRSLEKYLSEVAEVIIVGDVVPEWLNNATQLSVSDVKNNKQLSIRKKILAALEYADEFLFMNDDVYFTRPAVDFPYYWHGLLKTHSETGTRQLEKRLTELNLPTKLFDGHYPLTYDQRFKEASKYFQSDCIIKSMYCNFLKIEGEFTHDCKLLKPTSEPELLQFVKNNHCFSTGVVSLQSVAPVLEKLFPNESKYEI